MKVNAFVTLVGVRNVQIFKQVQLAVGMHMVHIVRLVRQDMYRDTFLDTQYA